MDRLITLLGGTGFLGAALVERLAARRWRTRIAVRHPGRADRLKPLGDLGQIGAVRCDLRVPATVLAAMEGADAAVNLVGILDEKHGQRFADIQAKGAGTAAAAAARAGVHAFVHVSAIGADPASPSAYGRTKAEGEAAVRAAFPAAAIVRPSLVFGAEDGFTNRFASVMAMGPAIPVVAPATRFQPVYVGDVADAILAAMDRPGETFELGGPDVRTMKELMADIAKSAGQDKPLVVVPDFAARAMAAFGSLPGAPLTRDQYLMLQRDNVADPAMPGLAALGITPTPMGAVMDQWLARYRPGGRFAAKG
jgi:NADH dehydrogenase